MMSKMELLNYLKNNISYYSDIIEEDVNESNFEEVYNSIPYTDKTIMKRHTKFMVSKRLSNFLENNSIDYTFYKNREQLIHIDNIPFYIEFTSGTSGIPFFSIKTLEERIILGKTLWKNRRKILNIDNNEFLDFIHSGRDDKNSFPFKQEKHLDKRIEMEVEYLKKSKFQWWHTNISSLEYYDSYLKKNKISFPYLKIIENNGCYISDTERSNYEELYNCKVIDNYGCREVWNIAFECSEGNLHVCPNNIFNLVDEEGSYIQKSYEVGEVEITSRVLKSMPIVKYRLGDRAYYCEVECKCGNKNKIIKIVPTRTMIINTNKNGNFIFRMIILDLLLKYEFSHFDSVHVTQISEFEFLINANVNICYRTQFEKIFKGLINQRLGNNYKTFFDYKVGVYNKSIFSINIKKEKSFL